MVTAGHGSALSRVERPGCSPEVERAARAYLEQAGGDLGAALVLAVTDGMGVARLVSRGFARRGRVGSALAIMAALRPMRGAA